MKGKNIKKEEPKIILEESIDLSNIADIQLGLLNEKILKNNFGKLVESEILNNENQGQSIELFNIDEYQSIVFSKTTDRKTKIAETELLKPNFSKLQKKQTTTENSLPLEYTEASFIQANTPLFLQHKCLYIGQKDLSDEIVLIGEDEF